MIYIVINCLFIEEIQFKAPIPRQGILLIGDFTIAWHHVGNSRDFNLKKKQIKTINITADNHNCTSYDYLSITFATMINA